MKKLMVMTAALALAACGSTKLLTPTQSDADRGAQMFPNYTLAELNEGKTLFENNCGQCHGLKNPASRNEEKWRKVVPRMVGKVNKKAGHTVLDAKAQETLLRYVLTMRHAQAPKQ